MSNPGYETKSQFTAGPSYVTKIRVGVAAALAGWVAQDAYSGRKRKKSKYTRKRPARK